MDVIQYLKIGFSDYELNSIITTDTATDVESISSSSNVSNLLGTNEIVLSLDKKINNLFILNDNEIINVYKSLQIKEILLHLIFILAVIQYYTFKLEKVSSVEDKESIKMELRKYLGYLKKFLKLVAPIFLKKYNSNKSSISNLLYPYIKEFNHDSDTIKLNKLIIRTKTSANKVLNSWGIYKSLKSTTQKIKSKFSDFKERTGETLKTTSRFIGVRGGRKSSKKHSRKTKKSRKG
jgi:hypothetical protein